MTSAMLTSSALAQGPTDVSQYGHTSWSVADGFTKGAVHAITQTADGYLWLGTEFGLLRFDGVRTTPWPSDRILPSSQIRTLLTGRDGTLWIGTSKGLASWKDGRLTGYEPLTEHLILRTIEGHDGAIWVLGTTPPTGKLCEIRNRSVRCWGEDGGIGSGVTAIYEDRRGTLWLGERGGVRGWNKGETASYLSPGAEVVHALSEDVDGTLLVFVSGTIYRMSDGQLREAYRLPAAVERATGFRILRDRDGATWVGTLGGGLARLHQGSTQHLSHSDGLSSDSVSALFQDREGTIWVGTHAGLDRFRELPVTPFSTRQGLSSARIFAVVASTDGSVWVRTVDGVNQLKDGRVTVYSESSDLSERSNIPSQTHLDDSVSSDPGTSGGPLAQESGGSLFRDERGRLWLSTSRSVGYLDQGRFVTIPSAPGGRVSAIAGDLMGSLWFAHQTQGLFRVAGERVVARLTWAQLGHTDFADALAVDASTGGLWLGFFRGGVAFLRDGAIVASYTAANGMAPGRINDLRFGPDGALWAAAEGGVSRVKDGRVTTLSSQDGLPCTETHWTIEDDEGDFWLYMPCGLVKISRSELEAWASRADSGRPSLGEFRPTVFDSSDGVRSRANGGPFGPSVAKASDGKLWFFPLEGLSVINPRRLLSNTLAPPVQIEQISADGRIHQAWSEVRLAPLIRDLEIDYTALSLVAPDKVMFRVKLEGRDREWLNVGNRRQAFYTNLRPGSYRFRVMASNNSGVWNETGAAVDFSVAPAYYQTTWFAALTITAVIALVWGGHRVRLRIVERHQGEISALNERLMKAQEQERIRIAGELHDGVMQEMLAVTMMLGTAKRRMSDNADAAVTIDKAQQKLIQAGTDIRRLSHDLHPPLLQEAGLPRAVLAYCEQFSAASSVPVDCEADESVGELSRGAALALFRILQEALGNAAKHAAASRIVVRLTRSDGVVSLTVEDNGVGFERGRLASEGGLGLIMMRERASQLNGTFDFDTAPTRGTTIKVVIPFR
jgi:signal transduction histidine kinase/ligand-binding sensor domain-containing protein